MTRFHVKLSKLPEIAFLCVNFVYFCAFLSFSGNFRQILAGSPRIKGEMVSLWPGVRQGPSRSVKVRQGWGVRQAPLWRHTRECPCPSVLWALADRFVRQGPSRSVKVRQGCFYVTVVGLQGLTFGLVLVQIALLRSLGWQRDGLERKGREGRTGVGRGPGAKRGS